MGNKLTIVNETFVGIICKLRVAGSTEKDDTSKWHKRRFVSSNCKEVFKLSRSKTYILSIGEATEVVVFRSDTLFVQETFNNDLTVAVKIEKKKQVYPYDEQHFGTIMPYDQLPSFIDSRKYLHEIISLVYKLVLETRNGLSGSTNKCGKDVGQEMIKKLSDSCWNMSSLNNGTDSSITTRLDSIQQSLVGIARTIGIGYPYFISISGNKNKNAITFFYEQLSKITNTDMLPFLEQCCTESSFALYIFSFGLACYIFRTIGLLKVSNCTYQQDEYLNLFLDHMETSWQTLTEEIETNCKTTVKNGRNCLASLSYRGKVVCNVTNMFSRRAIAQIEDVKRSFIRNRRNKMDHFFNDPLEFIALAKEQLEVSDNDYVYIEGNSSLTSSAIPPEKFL